MTDSSVPILVRCPMCGHMLSTPTLYCPGCGEPLRDSAVVGEGEASTFDIAMGFFMGIVTVVTAIYAVAIVNDRSTREYAYFVMGMKSYCPFLCILPLLRVIFHDPVRNGDRRLISHWRIYWESQLAMFLVPAAIAPFFLMFVRWIAGEN